MQSDQSVPTKRSTCPWSHVCYRRICRHLKRIFYRQELIQMSCHGRHWFLNYLITVQICLQVAKNISRLQIRYVCMVAHGQCDQMLKIKSSSNFSKSSHSRLYFKSMLSFQHKKPPYIWASFKKICHKETTKIAQSCLSA